jgi:hypothetical protein
VSERLQLSGYELPAKDNREDSNNIGLTLMVADILKENNATWKKTKKPGLTLQPVSIEYQRMWDYMNSDLFKVNRPLYFPDRNPEESGARKLDKGYVRGW